MQDRVYSAPTELTKVRGGQSASTEQNKGREHSRDRNPKGRDKTRGTEDREDGPWRSATENQRKIRSRGGPGGSGSRGQEAPKGKKSQGEG